MELLKMITTGLIVMMMLIFLAIWASTKENKDYYWIWILIEAVYIFGIVSIWG